jgi:hypothetical protein
MRDMIQDSQIQNRRKKKRRDLAKGKDTRPFTVNAWEASSKRITTTNSANSRSRPSSGHGGIVNTRKTLAAIYGTGTSGSSPRKFVNSRGKASTGRIPQPPESPKLADPSPTVLPTFTSPRYMQGRQTSADADW